MNTFSTNSENVLVASHSQLKVFLDSGEEVILDPQYNIIYRNAKNIITNVLEAKYEYNKYASPNKQTSSPELFFSDYQPKQKTKDILKNTAKIIQCGRFNIKKEIRITANVEKPEIASTFEFIKPKLLYTNDGEEYVMIMDKKYFISDSCETDQIFIKAFRII